MKINPDKIRDVIGKGGAVIQALTKETGTSIDITMMAPLKLPVLQASKVKKPNVALRRLPLM